MVKADGIRVAGDWIRNTRTEIVAIIDFDIVLDFTNIFPVIIFPVICNDTNVI